MKKYRLVTAAVAALFVVAVLGWLSGGQAVAATATTFSGRATVVQGQVAGISVGPFVDTGPVDAGGGHLERTFLEYPIEGVADPTNGALRAEVLHAAVVAHGNKSSAEAFVASLSLSTLGQSVSAEVLSARASASCNGSSATVSGSSEVADLTVNGQRIAVSGQVNQNVPVPGFGVIVINEQIVSASGQNGDITVNALHIVLTDPLIGTKTDLIVASAHADIACGGTSDLCLQKDFVTGGGWITTSTGARANFAVAGGPDGWGHLNYIDHGGGLKVKGTGVTKYEPTGPTSRHIEGTATINGQPGTYQADVADNGEPGRADTYWLRLSSGYTQRSTLEGGNIQLHCK
ncbi:MAG TPA: choice-of-anchor P family protein [Candidatus Limnocylindria bacterium]|nr:choice-of-anchor P family protein [Candidatus Limnocylindria bacterium]